MVASACGSSSHSSPSTAGSATSSPAHRAQVATTVAPKAVLTSAAFANGTAIPRKYACTSQGGSNLSPPLEWSGFPGGEVTLVLIVHDPDAPVPGGFTHLVTTIPSGTTSVADGDNRTGGPMQRWMGPCPPSGTHHYRFTLYAFPGDVSLPAGADKKAVDALAPRAMVSATLTGLFSAAR